MMAYGNIQITDRFDRLVTSRNRKPRASVLLERQGRVTDKVKNLEINRRFKNETTFDLHEPVPSTAKLTLVDTEGELISGGHSTISARDKIKIWLGFEGEKIKVPRFTGVVTDAQVNTATREIHCDISDYGWLLKQHSTSGDCGEYNTPRLLVNKLYEELNVGSPNFEVACEYPLSFVGGDTTNYETHSRSVIDGFLCGDLSKGGVGISYNGGNILNVGTDDLSISFWYRNPPPGGNEPKIDKCDGGSGPGFYITMLANMAILIIDDGTNYYYVRSTSDVGALTEWMHLAFVTDRDNGSNWKVYKDGADVTGVTSGTLPGDADSSADFKVGKLYDDTTTQAQFRMLRIYIASDDHWTDAQVLAQYNKPNTIYTEGMGSMTAVWPFDDSPGATSISSADSIPYTYRFGNTDLSRRNYWQIIDGALKAIGYLFYLDEDGELQAKRRDSFTDVDIAFDDSNIIDIRYMRRCEMINEKGVDHTGTYPPWGNFSLRDSVRWGESTYTLRNILSQARYGVYADYESEELVSGFDNIYLFVKEAIKYYSWPRYIYLMTIFGDPRLQMLDRVRVRSKKRKVEGKFVIIGMTDKFSPGYYHQELVLLSEPKRF